MPPTGTYVSSARKKQRSFRGKVRRKSPTSAESRQLLVQGVLRMLTSYSGGQVSGGWSLAGFLPVGYEALLSVSAVLRLHNDNVLLLLATLIKTNWCCYLKGSSLPWGKQACFVSIRNANAAHTHLFTGRSPTKTSPLCSYPDKWPMTEISKPPPRVEGIRYLQDPRGQTHVMGK